MIWLELFGGNMNKLKFDEFLRSVNISKENSYSLLLGAGCSVSSGIQSAYDCIWEWKKMIYKSNNPNSQEWIENFKNPKVQDSIQNWLDNQGGYIDNNHSDEYSFYAKKCFQIDDNRRQYFQNICANKIPSAGYRTIPILVKHGILDSIWTTNFDDLVFSSCINGGVTGIDISLDTVERINKRTQSKNELPIIKLHGDFKYGDLKNTSEELKNQDNILRRNLINYLADKHLIILGYSGRDLSIMETLKEAYSNSGAGILYWCGYGEYVSNEIVELFNFIESKGRKAFYIGTDGFDITMLQLSKLIVEENDTLKKELAEIKSISKIKDISPFDLKIDRVNKVLKSNLYSIEFPKEILVFNAKLVDKPWKTVKDKTLLNNNVAAAPFGINIWAFGKAEDVHNIFSDIIIGSISRKPLNEFKIHNNSTYFLLLSSISKLLSGSNQFKSNFKDKIWEENNFQIILGKKVYNAVKIGLESINGKYYISFNPDFQVEEKETTKEVKQQIGLNFFHKIYNNKYNEYIDDWRKKLITLESIEFPLNSGTGFYFKISKKPIYTSICDLNSNVNTNFEIPTDILNFKGVQFKENNLVFSTKNGNKQALDVHPMRGLLNNSPFESGLNFLSDKTINLGVICPESDSQNLFDFLNFQNQIVSKNNPSDNYIIDYKGFFEVYGISLNIPNINSQNWEFISNPIKTSEFEIVQEIKNNIYDKINKLCSIGTQKIVIIYIPKRWDNYLTYNTEIESFDLHDYIKAFCAEKCVTSQIIREKTMLDKNLNCQINWWLSLSFFVKSFRTPWVIENADKSTAFAGIGYSIDNRKDSNGHIVLGCSHIYNSNGEGLKYKLSRVNDKVNWINEKPHLSYDDAYEFGKNVLNLFYESMNEFPKRVVIHKRTFFTEEEKNGILDSLLDSKKIENIDLVEINFEDNIRYLSSVFKNNKFEIDTFSVSRGTCIQLNQNEALLFAHGIIQSVSNSNFKFYPGGRYIPKPLRIIKHYGSGSLEQISNEILGLTKMNWNSLNMYSQLPATISSSNEIARIGKLMGNTENVNYDYRYFI